MKPIILYFTYPGAAPSAGDMDRAIKTSLATHLTGLTKLSGDHGLAAPMPGTTVMLKAMPASFPANELTNDLAQRGAWPT